MLDARRQNRRIAFRPTGAVTVVDTRFPRAVAGEDYERFTRAMWRQAERWFHRHAHRISGPEIVMHDARDVLWSVASVDLTRGLYPQEERLLSDLLQHMWPTRRADPAVPAVPEIPSFLVRAPIRG